MAGFFSLGRGSGGGNNSTSSPRSNPDVLPLTTQLLEVGGGSSSSNRYDTSNPSAATHHHHHQISPENLLMYRNQEITYKGFELWQNPQTQSQQFMQDQHHHHPLHHRSDHHHQHHQQQQDLYSTAVGLGVGPSTTTARTHQHHRENPSHNSSSSTGGGGDNRSGGGGGEGYNLMVMKATGPPGGVNCQDCGNQAKKDCPYMRCRTCCKSRGFQCSTHVKSTWVPASKRRERHQQIAALHEGDEIGGGGSKRLRENAAAASGSGSRVPGVAAPTTIITGTELGNFPPEITSPALFRCVRVTSPYDDNVTDDQIAYQTAVNIGGHLFKGILYDQGLDHNNSGGGDTSSGTQPPPVNLLSSGSMTAAAVATNSPVLNFFDPSSLYPAAAQQLSSFMAGTQFFPNQRPS